MWNIVEYCGILWPLGGRASLQSVGGVVWSDAPGPVVFSKHPRYSGRGQQDLVQHLECWGSGTLLRCGPCGASQCTWKRPSVKVLPLHWNLEQISCHRLNTTGEYTQCRTLYVNSLIRGLVIVCGSFPRFAFRSAHPRSIFFLICVLKLT